MDRHRYHIQFSATLLPGTDADTARAALKARFNLSDQALADLFSGQCVTIRRNIDEPTALRYQAAFRQAGALLQIIPAAQETAPPELDLDPRTWSVSKPGHPPSFIDRGFHHFERILAAVLLVLISGVAVLAVLELCFVLYQDVTSQKGVFLLDLGELFEIFGMFLIVLIAIELMASIYMYMMDKSVHVEIMLLIAITALTRKVVVLDLESKGDPALYMVGLAALLGTLVVGYYLVKRLGRQRGRH
ncbi:phosphate-starvation-inducible PsiE family protein [Thiocapsa imhoffii]|uniref:phosphate-starvation-inducible PsiE family protein n=1 Tax=Thiocapsa imhoffii TaxID=382777 RepID=UPI001903A94B